MHTRHFESNIIRNVVFAWCAECVLRRWKNPSTYLWRVTSCSFVKKFYVAVAQYLCSCFESSCEFYFRKVKYFQLPNVFRVHVAIECIVVFIKLLSTEDNLPLCSVHLPLLSVNKQPCLCAAGAGLLSPCRNCSASPYVNAINARLMSPSDEADPKWQWMSALAYV